MAEELKKIECDEVCGFKVQSHDEQELIEIGIQHAKKFHNLTFTVEEARKQIKPV